MIRCKAERASLFMVKNKAYSASILIDAGLLLVEYRVGRRIVVYLYYFCFNFDGAKLVIISYTAKYLGVKVIDFKDF